MEIGNKHIPLMVTSGLSLFTFFLSGSFISINSFFFDVPVSFGFIGVALTWFAILFKRKIWVYLLIALLILSFTPIVNLSYIGFNLAFGSVEINLFIVAILIAHFVLNFGDPAETPPPIPEGGWTKVNVLKHQYQDLSETEINTLLSGELTNEKRQALEELLESRNIR